VDFGALAPGTTVTVKNNAGTPFPNGPRAAHVGGPAITDVMRFHVGATSVGGTVPATLRGGAGQPPTLPPTTVTPTVVRDILLNEIIDPVTGTPVEALLNNLRFSDEMGHEARTESMERPVEGTVERWNLVNTTGDTHPIHLHLVQFQVLSRQRFDAARYLGAVNRQLRGTSRARSSTACHIRTPPDSGHGRRWPRTPTPAVRSGSRPPTSEDGRTPCRRTPVR
jgi:spore coat protein A, manganese oxidase